MNPYQETLPPSTMLSSLECSRALQRILIAMMQVTTLTDSLTLSLDPDHVLLMKELKAREGRKGPRRHKDRILAPNPAKASQR